MYLEVLHRILTAMDFLKQRIKSWVKNVKKLLPLRCVNNKISHDNNRIYLLYTMGLAEEYSRIARNLSLQDLFSSQLPMGHIKKYMRTLKHSSSKFYFGSKC
jgi:hypothetical protein